MPVEKGGESKATMGHTHFSLDLTGWRQSMSKSEVMFKFHEFTCIFTIIIFAK